MPIIIFLIILSALVFVHELGHFLTAKWAGVRVDEFGIGFPPRLKRLFNWRGTEFTLNWIPFGGFVKIFGENYVAETSPSSPGKKFTEVTKSWQIIILAAGVIFNFLFAWILLSIGFVAGLPYPTAGELGHLVHNPALTVVNVVEGSPAAGAGLMVGDTINQVLRGSEMPKDLNPESVKDFISKNGESVDLKISRSGTTKVFNITPTEAAEGNYILGISMDSVGVLKLPTLKALSQGIKTSNSLFVATTKGLGKLIVDAFRGKADLEAISGPVGIVGIVGDVTRLGFINILIFTAFISINLAVINLFPLPSLDGGRILFVLIEAVKGSPISPKVFNMANTFGFLLLICLMVVITIRDISNLF